MTDLKIKILRRGKISEAAKWTGIRLSRLSRIINGWDKAKENELCLIENYLGQNKPKKK